jgi:hypothetical protein
MGAATRRSQARVHDVLILESVAFGFWGIVFTVGWVVSRMYP